MQTPFWKTNWFRVTIGTLISVLFLYLALRDVPLEDVLQALARANYAWVALAILAMVVQSWLRAVRWILLYYPLHDGLRVREMWGISLIGQMLNIIVPWRIGEVARIYLAGEIERRSKVQTLATLGTEKIFDTLMLLAILLAVPLFMTLPTWLEQPRAGLVVLSSAMFAAAMALIFSKERLIELVEKIPALRRGLSLGPHAQKALSGLEVFRRWDVHLELQALSLAVWFLGALNNYLVLLALDLALPVVSAFLLLAVLQVGGLVPSSPGKVGVFQYLCILALSLFSIDKSIALTYGILLYFVAYGTPVVLGILFLWWGGVNLQRIAAEGTALSSSASLTVNSAEGEVEGPALSEVEGSQ
jgi:uncharacterized protein (TIRG00374 family)